VTSSPIALKVINKGLKQFLKETDPEVENGRKKLTASKRIGTTDDIANAILFLASDRSSYVNATSLAIDGGFSVMMQNQIPKPGGRRGFAETH